MNIIKINLMLTTGVSGPPTKQLAVHSVVLCVLIRTNQGDKTFFLLFVFFLLAITRWCCVLITVFGPVVVRGQFNALVVCLARLRSMELAKLHLAFSHQFLPK